MIHIKRRYETLASGPTKVGTQAVQVKVSPMAEVRIKELRRLAYFTLVKSGLRNVFDEFQTNLDRIAINGSDQYHALCQNLRYAFLYKADLVKAIDTITTSVTVEPKRF